MINDRRRGARLTYRHRSVLEVVARMEDEVAQLRMMANLLPNTSDTQRAFRDKTLGYANDAHEAVGRFRDSVQGMLR